MIHLFTGAWMFYFGAVFGGWRSERDNEWPLTVATVGVILLVVTLLSILPS